MCPLRRGRNLRRISIPGNKDVGAGTISAYPSGAYELWGPVQRVPRSIRGTKGE